MSVLVQADWASVATDSIASPAKPNSAKSLLASVNLTLARITNMDRRLSVGAKMSRLHTSRISEGLSLKPIKLACIRPLAEQKAAKRASDKPNNEKSWVS